VFPLTWKIGELIWSGKVREIYFKDRVETLGNLGLGLRLKFGLKPN